MRVVHLACIAPPEVGGMGQAAFEEVRALRMREIETSLVAPEANGVSRGGDFVVRLPSIRFGNAARLSPKELEPIVRAADVVHLHYPFYGTAGRVAAWRKEGAVKRLVVTAHMDAAAQGWKGKIFDLHRRFFQEGMLESADRVIFSSFDYARSASFASFVETRSERCVELPFGVDIERFSPVGDDGRRAARRRFGLPEEGKVVTFVGGMDVPHAFKGVDVLLDAAKLLPRETHFLFVGDGELRLGFESMAGEFGLLERCRFVGRVSRDALADAYRAGDVFAFPSVSGAEAFGLVAVEAQACGVPVVASALPGVRTVIADGETGLLVPPRDAAKLSDALRKLLGDDGLRARLGDAARRHAVERFSWTSHAAELERIYREVSAPVGAGA